jgi:NADH-quinone oxidoreductase subunit N
MKDYSIESFNGLAKSNPTLAFLTTLFLFSLAGIPLTAGFFAKYYMLNALFTAGAGIWLLITAVVFAAISVYYYFKLVQAMYFAEGTPAIHPIGKQYELKLWVIAIILLVLGVFPPLLFNYILI